MAPGGVHAHPMHPLPMGLDCIPNVKHLIVCNKINQLVSRGTTLSDLELICTSKFFKKYQN